MKLNKILMALSAMAIVGCSSEDFNDPSVAQAIDDSSLVQLGENFILAGAGETGNTMRTHWDWEGTPGNSPLINQFLPIWAALPSAGDAIYDNTTPNAKLDEQAIGLCWLGNGAVGTDVYTNYEFYHFGWLNNGETKANVECGKLTNGALYDEITVTPTVNDAANGEADKAGFTGYTGISGKTGTPSADLNFNSGVYKTENKAIFGGQYIVYYPYNENFKDAGTIPAVAETTFGDPTTTGVSTTLDTKELGKATFRYSAPVTIEGGNQAADFGLKNLSTLVQLRVALPAGDPAAGTQTIDQIVLYSPSQKLLKQANLAADKIAAGQTGEDLYASTEGTKTIVANFPAAGVNLNATDGVAPNSPISAYITVLPTTVDDLVALVHSNSLKKWARVNIAATEFKAGAAKQIRIPVALTDFQSEYIAVDEASLNTALTDARSEIGTDPAATPTITVIGDIKLATSPYTINNPLDAKITIKGDDIIVPQDVALYIKTNMESDVRVLGKSCCTGANGGRLFVEGGTINNVTMEKTEAKVNTPAQEAAFNPYTTYTGAATVAAGKTFDVQAGTVEVRKAVEHKGNINIKEDAKLVVIANGDLNFMGSTVVNDGTIEVLKDGKFDMTDANGNATATDGQRMTNNGTFIHNVDAQVGTAVQSMNQNGEYRCRVNDQIKLDDAFLQWTACSVIEIVEPSPAATKSYNLATAEGLTDKYKHNGEFIDIEVNTTSAVTFNDPNTNGDGKEIKIGNLTVTAGSLNINYHKGSGKRRTLTVNGDMTVAANTTITQSKLIYVKGNLTVEGAGVTLTYEGAKANEDGLKVEKDITVSGAAFDAGAGTIASDVDALGITCANFYLTDAATATFGNRNDGAGKNLEVSGTISNPAGCTFNIVAANQVGNSVLAWVTCKKLEVGGTFSAARPRVVQ